MKPIDQLSRPLKDLRISVTDRCNFRCRYCMPVEIFGANYEFLPRDEILRFGEIEQIAQSFVKLGVSKLRITGGEPLLRKDLPVLITKLAAIDGVEDIAMTTNAALLAQHAQALKDAGLHRVTVSLDSLDDTVFAEMNGVGAKPAKVIAGIDAALAVGLKVKLNTVVKKGVNDKTVVELVEFAKQRDVPVRFIEYMDTGNVNGWKLDEVVPSATLLEEISKTMKLVPKKNLLGETSKNYVLAEGGETDSQFEVGFISSVTKPFCSECNRARLSADGHIFTCLFASVGADVKTLVRENVSESQLVDFITNIWTKREDRYSTLRSDATVDLPKAEMSYLGG